jgi:hypothetical protein
LSNQSCERSRRPSCFVFLAMATPFRFQAAWLADLGTPARSAEDASNR